jgi:type II restriction/modification system DNA methylase subunit YeeA
VKKISNVENISDSFCQGILLTDNMTKISFLDYKYFTTLIPQLSRFPENESKTDNISLPILSFYITSGMTTRWIRYAPQLLFRLNTTYLNIMQVQYVELSQISQ